MFLGPDTQAVESGPRLAASEASGARNPASWVWRYRLQ